MNRSGLSVRLQRSLFESTTSLLSSLCPSLFLSLLSFIPSPPFAETKRLSTVSQIRAQYNYHSRVGQTLLSSCPLLLVPFLSTDLLSTIPWSRSLDLGQELGGTRGCPGAQGPCQSVEEGTWALGNWSAEVEEPGGWHEQGQGAMLGTAWETEGLQTLGIVVIVCASLKLLHLLGLISFSEGKGRYDFRQ